MTHFLLTAEIAGAFDDLANAVRKGGVVREGTGAPEHPVWIELRAQHGIDDDTGSQRPHGDRRVGSVPGDTGSRHLRQSRHLGHRFMERSNSKDLARYHCASSN